MAATNEKDELAKYSNYGEMSVDIAAPGDAILSLAPNGAYGFMSGTSMAAPHVVSSTAFYSCTSLSAVCSLCIWLLLDNSPQCLHDVLKFASILIITQ